MKVFAVTSNAHKEAEYRAQFWQYGVSSVEILADVPEADQIYTILSQAGNGSFLFREQMDLYLEDAAGPEESLTCPVDLDAHEGKPAFALCELTVWWIGKDRRLKVRDDYVSRVDGVITRPEARRDNVFGWDDVFRPVSQRLSYDLARDDFGKVTGRTLLLDQIIAEYVPFRSIRAFKYGRINRRGMVDLNFAPIDPKDSIQFDTLPADVFRAEPSFSSPAFDIYGVHTMLRNALAGGAHFRAARNRREWIYWAPGINAGIPLTPKEDKHAELIYLCHDFAHYVLPDLLIDTAPTPTVDAAIIARRMIGETLAMVAADMFYQDSLAAAGLLSKGADTTIHDVFRIAKPHLEPASGFKTMLKLASELLLKFNDNAALPWDDTPENRAIVDRFVTKFRKFALADYEWTKANLVEAHKHPDRTYRWIRSLGESGAGVLGLDTSSTFAERIAHGLQAAASMSDIIDVVMEEVLEFNVGPAMQKLSDVSLDEQFSRAARRYLFGQIAIYARFGRAQASRVPLEGYDLVRDTVRSRLITRDALADARAAISRDVALLARQGIITRADAELYQSVYPIVPPHYVSYSRPGYASGDECLRDIFPCASAGPSIPRSQP